MVPVLLLGASNPMLLCTHARIISRWRGPCVRRCSFSAIADEPSTCSPSTKKEKKPMFMPERFYPAFILGLATFHRHEGHFIVPYRFTIPTADNPPQHHHHHQEEEEDEQVYNQAQMWPKVTHGLPLGKYLKQLVLQISRKQPVAGYDQVWQDLYEIGFPVRQWHEYVWTTAVLPALHTYHKIYGNMFIPSAFMVPYGDPRWPRATWRYALGRKVSKLRHARHRLSEQQQQQLEEIDFIWNVTENRWHEIIYPALEWYVVLHGHCFVPPNYVTPTHGESWPVHLRGIRLGRVVHHIRSRGNFASVPGAHDQLRALKFTWHRSESLE